MVVAENPSLVEKPSRHFSSRECVISRNRGAQFEKVSYDVLEEIYLVKNT
jgi:hypothetical protein